MFSRRKPTEVPDVTTEETDDSAAPADGPRDAADVDLEDGVARIDLGGMLIEPPAGLDVQLQVDETSGAVAAVLLAGPESAVELRPFAAPRNGDVWDDVRRQAAAVIAQRGGTATEEQGPRGTELKVSIGIELPEGGTATQVSRVVGYPGPRWLLRATLFGRAAVEHREDGDVETALRGVVVVRGSTPLPPGEPLPLTVPPQAQRVDPADPADPAEARE